MSLAAVSRAPAGSAAGGRHGGGAPPLLLAKTAAILQSGGWTFQMGPLTIRDGAMESLPASLAHKRHELFFSPLWGTRSR